MSTIDVIINIEMEVIQNYHWKLFKKINILLVLTVASYFLFVLDYRNQTRKQKPQKIEIGPVRKKCDI